MGVACLKFRGETFAGGCEITKFVKVFSLESVPLYDTIYSYMYTALYAFLYTLQGKLIIKGTLCL